MGDERRRFQRIPHEFEVQYRRFSGLADPWFTVTAINLSASGIRFRNEEALEVGTKLELHIRLPGQEPFSLLGQVVWSELAASKVMETGVEFVDVSGRQEIRIDEMVQFLRKHG